MNETVQNNSIAKVADALKHSWVYYLPERLWPYAQLARWERPIGWQLLMWPCFWSFMLGYLAISNTPGFTINWAWLIAMLGLFLTGSFLMRGAGCTYNDLVDVDIDEKVERTRSRPLPAGRTTRKKAALFLILQAFGGFFVLLAVSALNPFAFFLGVASLITVAIYPFMKRITWWPQLFLGLAFSWGALMGWACVHQSLSLAPVLLYAGSIFWVIGYDTIYAHQDREDDAIVGVKSTARLFGEKSRTAITGLYTFALILFATAYVLVLPIENGSWTYPAWIGLALGGVQIASQIARLDIHDGDACLKLFKSNSLFGLILFAGLFLSLIARAAG